MEGYVICSLKYVPRVENVVVDSIAKADLSCNIGVHHLRQMPGFCSEVMGADACGLGQHKKVPPVRPYCSSSSAVTEGLYGQGDMHTDSRQERQDGRQIIVDLHRHEEVGNARQDAGVARQHNEEWCRHGGVVDETMLCRPVEAMAAATLERKVTAGVEGMQEGVLHDAGVCRQKGVVVDVGLCRHDGAADDLVLRRQDGAVGGVLLHGHGGNIAIDE